MWAATRSRRFHRALTHLTGPTWGTTGKWTGMHATTRKWLILLVGVPVATVVAMFALSPFLPG